MCELPITKVLLSPSTLVRSAVQRRRHRNEEDGPEDVAADDESDLDAHGKGDDGHFGDTPGRKGEKKGRHGRIDERRAQDGRSEGRQQHDRCPRESLDDRGADLVPLDTGEAGAGDAAGCPAPGAF